MVETIFLNLKEILETKPSTPKCPEDKPFGPCLIWTRDVGWKTKPVQPKEELHEVS
jgi:hypothetical protein